MTQLCYVCAVVALAAGFVGALALLTREQARERRELYDRIMAGSLEAYKDAAREKKPSRKEAPPQMKGVNEWKKRE